MSKPIPVYVGLEPDVFDEVTSIAKNIGMTKSGLIKYLINKTIELNKRKKLDLNLFENQIEKKIEN